MKTINISQKKYSELERVQLDNCIYNTESEIYDFNRNGEDKIFKRLFVTSGSIFANKLFNIEMLNEYKDKLPSSFCIPDNLVSVQGKIVGFTLPKLNAVNFNVILNDNNFSVKEKMYYLYKIGELLNQLKNIRKYSSLNTIFLNDINESNFMVDLNKKEIYAIDLDSVRFINNSAFPSKYLAPNHFVSESLNKYIKNDDINNGSGYLIANENSDLLCYNVLILNFLFGNNICRLNKTDFYEYLKYLIYLNFNKELLDSFNRLKTSSNNINPYLYLDNLSEEQIYRANYKVYKYIKKK